MAEKSCSNQGCTKESCEGCPSKKTSFLVDQNIYSNPPEFMRGALSRTENYTITS